MSADRWLTLDGVDDLVSVPHHVNLDFGASQDFTLIVRLRSTQASTLNVWPNIVSKFNDPGGGRAGYVMVLHDSNIDARWSGIIYVGGTGFSVDGSTDVADGNWHTIAFGRAGSNLRSWEDGVFVRQVAGSTGSIANTSANMLWGVEAGASHADSGLAGDIAIVLLYNRALSDQEVADAHAGSPPADFVEHWPIDEGTGSTTTGVNAHIGTITGAQWGGLPPGPSIIRQDGIGDYTTIAAWAAAADAGTIGEISDIAAYNEHVTLATGNLHLRAAEGVRHQGLSGTGHARISTTGTGHIFTVTAAGVRVSDLEVAFISGAANSDEAFRVAAGTLLVQRCLIHTAITTANSMDGVYGDTNGANATIENCAIWGWGRAGVMANGGSAGITVEMRVEHCVIDQCGGNPGTLPGHGIHLRTASATATAIARVYNTVSVRSGGGDFGNSFSTQGTHTWEGTNNTVSDTSLTTVGLATGAQQSKVAGSLFEVPDSRDYRPIDPGDLVDSGVDRTSATPDARSELNVDIVGASRPQGGGVERGAFEIVVAPPPPAGGELLRLGLLIAKT